MHSNNSQPSVNQNHSPSDVFGDGYDAAAYERLRHLSDLNNVQSLRHAQLEALYTTNPFDEQNARRRTEDIGRFIRDIVAAKAAYRADHPPSGRAPYDDTIQELNGFYWIHPKIAQHMHEIAPSLWVPDFRPRTIPTIIQCPCCPNSWFGAIDNWEDFKKYRSEPKQQAPCPDCMKIVGKIQEICVQHFEPIIEAPVNPPAEVRRLRALPYPQYLKSDHWQIMRQAARQRACNRCQLCNTGTAILDTHHRTYENLGCEQPEDLTVLCRACHDRHHDIESEVRHV